jgi:hypothetical protein
LAIILPRRGKEDDKSPRGALFPVIFAIPDSQPSEEFDGDPA